MPPAGDKLALSSRKRWATPTTVDSSAPAATS